MAGISDCEQSPCLYRIDPEFVHFSAQQRVFRAFEARIIGENFLRFSVRSVQQARIRQLRHFEIRRAALTGAEELSRSAQLQSISARQKPSLICSIAAMRWRVTSF